MLKKLLLFVAPEEGEVLDAAVQSACAHELSGNDLKKALGFEPKSSRLRFFHVTEWDSFKRLMKLAAAAKQGGHWVYAGCLPVVAAEVPVNGAGRSDGVAQDSDRLSDPLGHVEDSSALLGLGEKPESEVRSA